MKKALSVSLASVIAAATFGWAPAQAQGDDVIVVKGRNIPDEKRATSEISNLLDEQAFARQGDADIAGALSRVTGLSTSDGKFVIVRGLSDRYGNVTLNGSPLPSPEPFRRTPPLDLFPTSILSGSLVQKTFSPEFSGEFGGGLIALRTKKVPNEDFLEMKVGFSVNTETTGSNGLFLDSGDTDFLGFDDGTRSLPGATAVLANGPANPPTQAEQDAADISFNQRETLLISEGTTPINGEGSISFGKILKDDGDIRIGTVGFIGYKNDWETREGLRQRPRNFDGQVLLTDGDNRLEDEYFSTEQEINLNLLSSTGFEIGDYTEIGLTGILLRQTSKEARLTNGFDGDLATPVTRRENTEFIERQIFQLQLDGDHEFPDAKDLQLKWRVAYGEAERDVLYDRGTTFEIPNGQPLRFDNGQGDAQTIRFSFVDDENFYAGADFVYPGTLGDRTVDVKFGASYADKTRNSIRRDFNLSGIVPNELLGSRADQIFSPQVFQNFIDYDLQALRAFPDLFEGTLEISAAYFGVDAQINDFVRFAGGLRYEESTQETASAVTGIADSVQRFDGIEEDYLLPAATFTFEPYDNIKARVGYSKTINRPQFRELSPSIFVDRDTDISFFGNPFLQNTEIDNFDARFEWYFARGENLTVGVFYKDIENAIEEFISTQGNTPRTSFVNAPNVELSGLEVEFERNFPLYDVFPDSPLFSDKEFAFRINYTYTDSEVNVSDSDIVTLPLNAAGGVSPRTLPASAVLVDGRQLQGQSENLLNLQLGLENPDTGMTSTLLLNFTDDRIKFVGELIGPGRQLPDVIEEGTVTLDYVLSQPITLAGSEMTLGLKIKNILNEDFNLTQTDAVKTLDFEQYDKGQSFSISLKKTF